jgi:uncharacterized protein
MITTAQHPPLSAPREASAAQPSMSIRKLDIDLSKGFDRHWFGGNAFRSQYYNALSMSFPVGEQLFIDAVKAGLDLLPDTPTHTALRSQCKDFIAQEATHRHIHTQYNSVLASQGLRNHIEPRIMRRYTFVQRWATAYSNLAATAAYEHYTAVFAEITLARAAMMAPAEPALRKLWCWHALEETEHKAVAFDLYRAIGGGYALRAVGFIYASLLFGLDSMRQTTNNLWHDGSFFKLSTTRQMLQFFWGRPSRGGGWFWLSVGPLLNYLRPSFHPWQHNNSQAAQHYAQTHANDWTVVR